MTIFRKKNLIMKIPTCLSIEKRNVTMNMNILIHQLVVEGIDGGVMVEIMTTSPRLR